MIILCLCAVPGAYGNEDTIYPSGYHILSRYDLSTDVIRVTDTLTITRTVENNESFGLANLYVTENLPENFEILYSEISIDQNAVPYFFSGPLTNQVLPGYAAYRWVLDFPSNPNPVNILNPGKILTLKYRVICGDPGIYNLPLHSSCFHGAGTGFFGCGDQISVRAVISETIPALGEWGMIILSLLLISAGTVSTIRKARPAFEFGHRLRS